MPVRDVEHGVANAFLREPAVAQGRVGESGQQLLPTASIFPPKRPW